MRMCSLIGGLCAFLFTSLTASAAPPPLEAYGELPLFSDAALSPDGTRIAAIANTGKGSRLIIMDRHGGVTLQIGIDTIKPRGVKFYDNDHVLALVSATTRTFGFRSSYEFSGAFSINVREGKVVPLLDRTEGLFPAQSGLGRIVGRGDQTGTILMPAYMGSAYQAPPLHLLKVNLETGRGRVTQKGTTDTVDWFTDGMGGVLAREIYNNGSDRYAVQTYDRGWKTIFEQKNADVPPFSVTSVLPDGSGLAFIVTSDEERFDGLMTLGFDGKISGPILKRPGRDIEAVYNDGERRLLGVRYSGMEPEYEFLDPGLSESYELITKALPNAIIYLNSWSDDRKTLLYSIFDPSLGEGWFLHDVASGRLDPIAQARETIPLDQIAIPMGITYSARDGLRIPAVVTLPPGSTLEEKTPRPLIVLPHGGPASYDGRDFDWLAQFLASRGYVVLQPNFRGSAGFGKEFMDAGRGEWGAKMQDDLTDGIEALSEWGVVDPGRVCIVGASYGGYAALAGAVFTPDVYQCSVAIAPVSDLNVMLADTRMRRGNDHWAISYWTRIMADGDARRERLRQVSPAQFADRARIPVLLIHGEDDTVVPISQSELMARALKKAGKKVELVRLKGEDHWLSVADTRLQLLKTLDAFLAEHLPVSAASAE